MHELMNAQLELAIRGLGGKHGIPEFLRTNVPGLEQERILVPSLVFSIRDCLKRKMRDALGLACEFFCTQDVVVRSSEWNDYCGLIDAMPTKVGNISEVDLLIEEVKRQCRDPGIAAYSKREGGCYDPGNVTLSVSPLLTMGERVVLRGLVTEHPNLPGVSCVDLVCGGVNHADGGDSFSCDFLYDRALPLDVYGDSNRDMLEAEAREGLALARFIRRANVFPNDRALQYEFVKWNRNGRRKDEPHFSGEKSQGVFLTQVKFFADKRIADHPAAEIDKVFDQKRSYGFRNFGITPPEGLVLPCVYSEFQGVNGTSRSAFAKFEREHPGVPYAAYLNTDGLTQPLTLRDCFPRMMAYLPQQKPSVDHKHSRPMMHVDRNKGVSFLNNPQVMYCEGAKHVKVWSDGLHQSVGRVD